LDDGFAYTLVSVDTTAAIESDAPNMKKVAVFLSFPPWRLRRQNHNFGRMPFSDALLKKSEPLSVWEILACRAIAKAAQTSNIDSATSGIHLLERPPQYPLEQRFNPFPRGRHSEPAKALAA
jgi:hypothetical protein